jgi:23S rRNA (guanosine2251-2'-O)-methyltransferase
MKKRDFSRQERPKRDAPERAGAGRPRSFGRAGGGRFQRDRRPERHDADGPALLYGWHTVQAALQNPQRRFLRLLATENGARRLHEEGVALPLEPEIVRPAIIDARLGPDAVHQGLLAEAETLPIPAIDELPAQGIVLVLDQITDPHNVGAIFRTAAAFAATAIVTTARHSPEATGVLAKAASGALEYVPLATVTNLSRGMEELREHGFQLIGLDSTGAVDLSTTTLRAPLALVLGAEGKGLRQKTRENCDTVARLDLPGRIKSLNVSNATVLALHIATTKLGL